MNKRLTISSIFVCLCIFLFSVIVFAWQIPDTGQTKCYNNTQEIPCPNSDQPFYGQDAQYISNPPSYTKLAVNGMELSDSATSWAMVRDNVTGLIWENKNNFDGIEDYSNPHDADNYYSRYWSASPNTYASQLSALNTENFGGYSDWRLPTVMELSTILNLGNYGPAIDKNFFTDCAGGFWSSNVQANHLVVNAEFIWFVDFSDGNIDQINSVPGYSNHKKHVRAVRGATLPGNDFVANGDGTVTDNSTGLMWQQEDSYEKWQGALSYCENLNLAGHNDWRLPNRNELFTILKLGLGPFIDEVYFPDTSPSHYMASTTNLNGVSKTWSVDFQDGSGSELRDKAVYGYFRCVRGGLPEPTLISLTSFTVTPKAGKVIIEWNTEAEIDNVGFNLYRATAEDGGYIKINDALIAAEGSSTRGVRYAFIDSGLRNGKAYYYELEDIDTNGNSTFHGPVKAVPRWWR